MQTSSKTNSDLQQVNFPGWVQRLRRTGLSAGEQAAWKRCLVRFLENSEARGRVVCRANAREFWREQKTAGSANLEVLAEAPENVTVPAPSLVTVPEVVAMTPDDYEAWLAGGRSTGSAVQNGERLFTELSCITCHKADSSGRGPTPSPHRASARAPAIVRLTPSSRAHTVRMTWTGHQGWR